METHDLVQGSPEWLAYRATKLNSSDAPAMMGVSTLKTRTQLLNEMKTGVSPEPDAFTAKLFAEGHRCEALCRPVAEEVLGEELYPSVCSLGELSASLDGMTMTEDTVWEHKMLNAELRAMFAQVKLAPVRERTKLFNELLHPMYRVQMEQQCIVTGVRRVLFSASEWDGDTLIEVHHGWYQSDPELAKQIVAGWQQLKADLETHVVSSDDTLAVVPTVIEALPALVVNVEGRVTSSNLMVFQEAAKRFLANVKTDLKTDQDFADAEQTVKFCKEGEERLDLVKAQAQAQSKSLDELYRAIDSIKESLRQTRLNLDKMVEAKKKQIRQDIIAEGVAAINEHIATLHTALRATNWLALPVPAQTRYAEVIKGKKTVASVRDAVNTAVAKDKIEMTDLANRMERNRESLVTAQNDYIFLFADFPTLGRKPEEDFSAIASARIREHEEAAQRRAVAAAAAPVAPAPAAPAVVSAPQQEVAGTAGRAGGRASAGAEVPTTSTGTEAELRNEWQAFDMALQRVWPQIEKHSAEVDRRRLVVARARMRAVFGVLTEEGEVTC